MVLCAVVLAGSGCARFDNAQSQPFTTEPQMAPPPPTKPGYRPPIRCPNNNYQ